MTERVVVAMSGGVDSSVSALLLKERGYDVIGVTLQLWDRSGGCRAPGTCCSPRDVEDARTVARTLGIPFYVVNFEEVFIRDVVSEFAAEYLRGRTPNPCILCNERIKFQRLLGRALELGACFLATGHYARIEGSATGPRRLLRGADHRKDQSYFLFGVSQGQLERILFPVGGRTKEEVRRIARRARLRVSDKKDSQEICFLPDGDRTGLFRGALEAPFPLSAPEGRGEIVTKEGKILGSHDGYYLFTIGQRRGLKVSGDSPLYVIGIDPPSRRVIVGGDSDLYSRDLSAAAPIWVSGEEPEFPLRAQAQIRSRHSPAPCRVHPLEGGRIRVTFDDAQRAITPGQAVVFYRGEEVLGGAWIERVDGEWDPAGSAAEGYGGGRA